MTSAQQQQQWPGDSVGSVAALVQERVQRALNGYTRPQVGVPGAVWLCCKVSLRRSIDLVFENSLLTPNW
jgi:hypothetical protein